MKKSLIKKNPEQIATPLELIRPESPVGSVASGSVASIEIEEEGDKKFPGQKTLIEHLKDNMGSATSSSFVRPTFQKANRSY